METMETVEDCDKRIAEIDEDIAKSTSEIDRLTIEVKKLKIARHYTVQLRQLFDEESEPEAEIDLSAWAEIDRNKMVIEIVRLNPGISHKEIMQEITVPLTARQLTYQLAYNRRKGLLENRGTRIKSSWYAL